MNSYKDFAFVYDTLTKDVDYQKRCDYIEALFEKFAEKKPSLIADLACGTGSVCTELDKRGYDMIGIDLSADMLDVAQRKNESGKILYLNQDICSFELYGTTDAFLCLLDSVNHLTEEGDLEDLFALVHNYLNPHGLFIFDVNTRYKFEKVLGSNTFVCEDSDIFYVWENSYEDGFCDMFINFFVKDGDSYKRLQQEHCERFYSSEALTETAKKHGLSVEAVYGELSFDAPDNNCERQFWVLKKM